MKTVYKMKKTTSGKYEIIRKKTGVIEFKGLTKHKARLLKAQMELDAKSKSK